MENRFKNEASRCILKADNAKNPDVSNAWALQAIASAIIYFADVMYKNGRHD